VKNLLGKLLQIWRAHLIVALLVGLVVGTCIGVGEGIAVLQIQGLFGRYNELVAWAIAFDAPAAIAVELGLGFVSGLIFSLMRIVPGRRQLVSLQLGETAFVIALAVGVWSGGTADPAVLASNPLGVLLPAGVVGLLLGGLVLSISMWLTVHAPLIRKLHARSWLLFEAVVVVIAIVFGFSR
jgi:hypothetical protein